MHSDSDLTFLGSLLGLGRFRLRACCSCFESARAIRRFFCSTRCSARGPVAYTQKSFSKTKQGTFRHDQSWMEATVIPPARITFAVQQETAKQTHHKPPKAHKTRHQAPAWSKAAKKKMPVANNLYNKEVKKYLPKPQS